MLVPDGIAKDTSLRASFYDALTPMREPADVYDSRHYALVPPEWFIAVSDIKGSTAAVEGGKHADVNFAAAAMIAALNNLCGGTIPYQFGGDGAVALIPPQHAKAARRSLAQVRRFARAEFKLDLRVGLAPITALSERHTEVRVGRYEPQPQSAYAVFLGDGIELMENSVKGRADDALAALAMIGDADDDGQAPDLTGLSCRWTPLKSARGKMVALVIRGPDHGTLHRELTAVAGVPALNAASMEGLQTRWPPKGLLREARARKRKGMLWPMTLRVAIETFVAYLFFKNNWNAGKSTYWAWAWGQLKDSQPAWLITIEGADLSKDGEVTITFDRALHYLKHNIDSTPRHDVTYTVDPDARSHNVLKGRITNGVIEVRDGGAFRMLQNPMVVNDFQLTNTALRIKMKPDGTLEGIMGGYQLWADIYSGFASGAPAMEICITGDIPGLYYLLKKHADASPDPKTGENMAISTAYHFEAVPAFIVGADGKLVAGQ